MSLTSADLALAAAPADPRTRILPIYCMNHPGGALRVFLDRDRGELRLFCDDHPEPAFLMAVLVAGAPAQ